METGTQEDTTNTQGTIEMWKVLRQWTEYTKGCTGEPKGCTGEPKRYARTEYTKGCTGEPKRYDRVHQGVHWRAQEVCERSVERVDKRVCVGVCLDRVHS